MLRLTWTFTVFVVSTAVFGGLATVASLLHPGSFATIRLGKLWAHSILAAAGVRVEVGGEENVSTCPSCVLISNHQSGFDILALLLSVPASTRFVAKESLFRIPFLGWSMTAAGFIPIDRTNRTRAIRSLKKAAESVRQGRPVILFAEGTRSLDGRLAPFKRGAFHLAVEAGVPVVPVAISGSWRILPPRSSRLRSGTIRVRFASPIPVEDPADDSMDARVGRLMKEVRRAMVQHLDPHELGDGDEALRVAAG
jgi:1-acyl-sn-glycerol-3-phosphate acyltransferase